MLSDYVTGAWGQEESLSPEEPPASQTPSHPLSLGNSSASFHKERNQAPQLQHRSNCVLIKGGLMAVAERWLWKADKALTAMLTATGGGDAPPGKKAGVASEASRSSLASTGLEMGEGCAGTWHLPGNRSNHIPQAIFSGILMDTPGSYPRAPSQPVS